MFNLVDYEVLIFDFDGVIIDSNSVKEQTFCDIFGKISYAQSNAIREFHRANLGVSRRDKIDYFINEVFSGKVEFDNDYYIDSFSKLSIKRLLNKNLLIEDCLRFIEANYKIKEIHIASASDERDLNMICACLSILDYFKEVRGGPDSKSECIQKIIDNSMHPQSKTVMIGDSSNDAVAAMNCGIRFFGYNNPELKSRYSYIDCLSNTLAI